MASRPPLPHDQIVAYLRGKSDKGTDLQILRWRNEDPAYQALFNLIDAFKTQTNRYDKIDAGNIPATFAAVEELLLRLYSGGADEETARQFIGGLLQSPVFYQRLWLKLVAIEPQTAPKKILSPEQMLTADTILARVEATVKPRVPVSETNADFIALVKAKLVIAAVLMWRARRYYAYALPLLLLGVIGILQLANRGNLDNIYASDERVPIPPPSGLRGASDYSQVDSTLSLLTRGFQEAMIYYLRRDYPTTVTALEKLAPFAQQLQVGPNPEKFLSLLREYYFYRGVSHFALVRRRKAQFASGEKARHQELAIQFLARADSLAQALQTTGKDRETFFLGLAYGFAGRRAEAVDQLKKIPASSSYYEQTAKPIAEWQSHK